jgi:hypothetical protein
MAIKNAPTDRHSSKDNNHNFKFQQQPKNFKLAKKLKENVDTTTAVSS